MDDFPFKKGPRYGTIICNAQTHRLIELFRSRNPDELIAWMDRLIEKSVRASSDRFPGYQATLQKKGVIVVSDRFHIIHNLWELLVIVCRHALPGSLPI
ncbi:transposase [Exiguobacterium sp. s133]|uniref:transposase n=1 Tax=Exiguobacterium sp. s133 TaxID=2751213 RepID=UPI001BE837F8